MNQIVETPHPVSSKAVPRTLDEYIVEALKPSLMPYSNALSEIQAGIVQFLETFGAAMVVLNRTLKPVIETIANTDWMAIP